MKNYKLEQKYLARIAANEKLIEDNKRVIEDLNQQLRHLLDQSDKKRNSSDDEKGWKEG